LETLPLPNQSGDHRLLSNEPVSNSSSSTMVAGASRLAGALGTALFVVAGGGLTVAGVVVVEPDASVVTLDPGTTVGTMVVVVVVAVVVRVVDLVGNARRLSGCVRALESRRGALDPEALVSSPTTPISTPRVATDTAMLIRAMAVFGWFRSLRTIFPSVPGGGPLGK
jgi:hypothetical protein